MASKQEWKRRALDATNTLDFWQRRADQLEQQMYLLKKEVAQAREWADRAEAALLDGTNARVESRQSLERTDGTGGQDRGSGGLTIGPHISGSRSGALRTRQHLPGPRVPRRDY